MGTWRRSGRGPGIWRSFCHCLEGREGWLLRVIASHQASGTNRSMAIFEPKPPDSLNYWEGPRLGVNLSEVVGLGLTIAVSPFFSDQDFHTFPRFLFNEVIYSRYGFSKFVDTGGGRRTRRDLKFGRLVKGIHVYGNHVHAVSRTRIKHSSDEISMGTCCDSADDFGIRLNRLYRPICLTEKVSVHDSVFAFRKARWPPAAQSQSSVPFVPDFPVLDFVAELLDKTRRTVGVTLSSRWCGRIAPSAITEKVENPNTILSGPVDACTVIPLAVAVGYPYGMSAEFFRESLSGRVKAPPYELIDIEADNEGRGKRKR